MALERSILQDKSKRTFVCIPAYLRDKFGLQKGKQVKVTDDGKHIIITPQGTE